MARRPISKKKKIQAEGDGARPWQRSFWEAMIGVCPGKDDVGPVGEKTRRYFTPEALWDMACLYFSRADEDTITKKDFIRSGEMAGSLVEVPMVRPLSWVALELFCSYYGVANSLNIYRENKNGRFDDFQPVVRRIDEIIRQQKFDQAAVGNFNPQLVIRDLGLSEKVDASLHQEQPLFVDTPGAPTSAPDSASDSDSLDQNPDAAE